MSAYEPLLFFAAFFFIYAFAGWCTEVAFHALTVGHFVNRGMLVGPVCPIYGFGMLLLIWLTEPFIDSWLWTFVASMVLCSVLELLAGLALRWIFHAQWWDYSDEPFNIAGFICLRFSIYWGFGGAFLIKVIHPTVAHLVGWLPLWLVAVFVALAAIVMLFDLVITVRGLLHFKRQHELLFDIEAQMRATSAEIGTNVTDWTLDVAERLEPVEKKLRALQEAGEDNLDDAKDALEALFDELEDAQAKRVQRQEARLQNYVEHFTEVQEEREARSLKRLHELKARLEALDEKRSSLTTNRPFTENRLRKAFPHLKWMDKK